MATKRSRRAALTAGLGLGGLAAISRNAAGDDPTPEAPQRADSPAPSAAIGVLDLQVVIEKSRKAARIGETIKQDAISRNAELVRIAKKLKEDGEELKRTSEGSAEYGRIKKRLDEAQAHLEAAKQKALRDFALRETEIMAEILADVEKVVAQVAKRRGLSLVLRISKRPLDPQDPTTVMSAIDRSVMYSDPRLDITAEVIDKLNGR